MEAIEHSSPAWPADTRQGFQGFSHACISNVVPRFSHPHPRPSTTSLLPHGWVDDGKKCDTGALIGIVPSSGTPLEARKHGTRRPARRIMLAPSSADLSDHPDAGGDPLRTARGPGSSSCLSRPKARASPTRNGLATVPSGPVLTNTSKCTLTPIRRYDGQTSFRSGRPHLDCGLACPLEVRAEALCMGSGLP